MKVVTYEQVRRVLKQERQIRAKMKVKSIHTKSDSSHDRCILPIRTEYDGIVHA